MVPQWTTVPYSLHLNVCLNIFYAYSLLHYLRADTFNLFKPQTIYSTINLHSPIKFYIYNIHEWIVNSVSLSTSLFFLFSSLLLLIINLNSPYTQFFNWNNKPLWCFFEVSNYYSSQKGQRNERKTIKCTNQWQLLQMFIWCIYCNITNACVNSHIQ